MMSRNDVLNAIRQDVSMENGDFRNIDLSGLTLDNGRFARCDFTDANLSDCYMRGTDFTGSIMRRVRMRESSLIDTAFIEADLTGADMWGCAFSATVCRGARMIDVRLDGCDLEDQKIDFSDAIGLHDAGFDSRGYRFVGVWCQGEWWVKAGCRWFNLGVARDHWGPSYRGHGDCLRLVERIAAAMPPV